VAAVDDRFERTTRDPLQERAIDEALAVQEREAGEPGAGGAGVLGIRLPGLARVGTQAHRGQSVAAEDACCMRRSGLERGHRRGVAAGVRP
jgi:hypothetical protein